MNAAPQISVVMSVHNNAVTLATAIDSILTQESAALEFIIVNDGSTDNCGELLDRYAERDGRLRVYHRENSGLTQALVFGCSVAKGKYIARQDADDVSLPGRLALQAAKLDANPAATLVGCWTECVDEGGTAINRFEPRGTPEERTELLRKTSEGIHGHGSALFRRHAYENAGGYRSAFYYAQDRDLWLRLSRFGQLDFVEKILYRFTQGPFGVTCAQRDFQWEFARLARQSFDRILMGQSDEDIVADAELLRSKAIAQRLSGPSRRDVATTFLLQGAQQRAHSRRNAMRLYLSALKACPLHARTWKAVALLPFQRKGSSPS